MPNPIAVVTGSSRGAGRGIAIALGTHGCTVYVTGRSEKEGDASLPGTIYETAAAVTAAGGMGIPVRVDHGDDAQVKVCRRSWCCTLVAWPLSANSRAASS